MHLHFDSETPMLKIVAKDVTENMHVYHIGHYIILLPKSPSIHTQKNNYSTEPLHSIVKSGDKKKKKKKKRLSKN